MTRIGHAQVAEHHLPVHQRHAGMGQIDPRPDRRFAGLDDGRPRHEPQPVLRSQ